MIEEFNNIISKFKEINEKGYIKGINNNLINSGGLTFESLLDKKADSMFFPDYNNIEIKCKQRFSRYDINLFSISFDGPELFESNYLETGLSEDEINEVDCVSGAFMMIKTPLYKKLSGFDTDFFMYGEDIVLCFTAKKQGAGVLFYPEATAIHLKGQSGLHTKSKTVLKYFYDSMTIFYKKNMACDYNPLVNFAVYSGIFLKKHISLFLSNFGGK